MQTPAKKTLACCGLTLSNTPAVGGDVLAVGGDLLPRVELLVAIEVAEKDLGAAVGVIVSDLDLEQLALGPSCQLRNKGTKFETEPTTKTETNV